MLNEIMSECTSSAIPDGHIIINITQTSQSLVVLGMSSIVDKSINRHFHFVN